MVRPSCKRITFAYYKRGFFYLRHIWLFDFSCVSLKVPYVREKKDFLLSCCQNGTI